MPVFILGSGGAWECEPYKGEPSKVLILAVFGIHSAVLAILMAASASPFILLFWVIFRIAKRMWGRQGKGGGNGFAGIQREKRSKRD